MVFNKTHSCARCSLSRCNILVLAHFYLLTFYNMFYDGTSGCTCIYYYIIYRRRWRRRVLDQCSKYPATTATSFGRQGTSRTVRTSWRASSFVAFPRRRVVGVRRSSPYIKRVLGRYHQLSRVLLYIIIDKKKSSSQEKCTVLLIKLI